jgi:hypothetical protein
MVSLITVFSIFIFLFAAVGAIRGWAKELLVTSAAVLGLFINAILQNYVTAYGTALALQPADTQFLMRGGLIMLLAFFGYQTPTIHVIREKLARERLQDVLLGLVLGALNGYLLVGSLWAYLHEAGYPTDLIIRPAEGSELANRIAELVAMLPPNVLMVPQIYFAVGLVFVFVIVVFV